MLNYIFKIFDQNNKKQNFFWIIFNCQQYVPETNLCLGKNIFYVY